MKLLLHVCCAPCVIYPLQELNSEGFDSITGFFYNPNIHPYTEYINRKRALEEYSKRHKLPTVFHKYDMENFFRHISGNEEQKIRCSLCWRMRLEETAFFASKNKYDSFTTTLLVSPYQDQMIIKGIGDEMAHKYNIGFFYKDFTSGFREAQAKAKEENLYRQKYCGCVFSERERYEKLKTQNSKPKTTT